MSVYAPVPLNVPLLARFGKLKFPEYKIYSSAPLFPGERAFRQYEASCELFVALELSQIIAKLVSNESATSRANNSSGGNSFINASSFEITKLMKRLLSTITDSVIQFFAPITLHLPCASSNTVMEARILQIGISASEFSIGSMSDHLMKYVNISIGRHTPCVSINTSSSVYQYCKSISIEASVAIVGTLCFISYIQEIYFNTDLNYSNASSSQSKPRPEFFASLDAGQKLTSLCSLAINEFEKQTCGCYSLATLLIQLLLSAHTQFVRHRRGRWLSRLCIDLEHIHQQYLKSATSDSTDGLYMLQVVDAAKSSVVYMPVTKERTNVFLLLSLIYAQAAMSDSCVRVSSHIFTYLFPRNY